MVYLTRKKIKGRIYLYLEESARIDGKRSRLWQKYLGPEDSMKNLKISSLFEKKSDAIKVKSLEFGISAALSQIAQKIQIAKLIDAHTDKHRDQGLSVGEYITIAAINRCSSPCSKSKLEQWFEHDWLSSRYEIEPKVLNAQTYWNHFRYLPSEKLQEIELAINKAVIAEYNLDLESLFYDPTNFFTFSKNPDRSELLQYGHSKENRNGNRLVSYFLLCARDSGVPLMHQTYAGNIQDANQFKEIPAMLKARLKALDRNPSQITLVFDKGNHSPEAFKAIDEVGLGFIVSARNSTQKDLLHLSRKNFTKTVLPATNKEVEYYKARKMIYGVNRDVYVVFDSKRLKKQKNLFQDKLKEKLSNIDTFFKDRLNEKKWRDIEAVEKKIKAIIGRNPFKSIISYNITGTYGKISFTLAINAKEEEKHLETLGKSILFTNKTDWLPEAIIWGYREQYIVEHAFRKMKSPTSIAVRPMYHYSDISIRAHVFVCVISLLLLSLLRLTLAQNSVSIGYEELLDELRTVHALKISSSPQAVPLWKLDSIDGNAAKIVKKLKLKKLL